MQSFCKSILILKTLLFLGLVPRSKSELPSDGRWGVEVKTTSGNNHQKVHISSERQLDIANIETLLLYHISLEVRQNSGETLNQIVQSLIDLLSSDFTSLNRFRNKLLEAGYFDQHISLYDDTWIFQ